MLIKSTSSKVCSNLEDKLKDKKEFKLKNEDKNDSTNTEFEKQIYYDKNDELNYPLLRRELSLLEIDQIMVFLEKEYSFDNFKRVSADDINMKKETPDKSLYSYKLILLKT